MNIQQIEIRIESLRASLSMTLTSDQREEARRELDRLITLAESYYTALGERTESVMNTFDPGDWDE